MDENTQFHRSERSEEAGADSRFGRAKQYVDEKYENASGAVRDGYNTMQRARGGRRLRRHHRSGSHLRPVQPGQGAADLRRRRIPDRPSAAP